MKSILSYFVNCEDSSATQQLSDQNESANMPSPSSEAFTSDESRKETGEEVLKGVEAPECATKKKRLADDPIECKQRCCDDTSGPFQTTDDTIFAKTAITYPDGKNGRFQVAWYKQYSWVVLWETKAKAFCFYCTFATSHNLMAFSSKAEDRFVTEGIPTGARS